MDSNLINFNPFSVLLKSICLLAIFPVLSFFSLILFIIKMFIFIIKLLILFIMGLINLIIKFPLLLLKIIFRTSLSCIKNNILLCFLPFHYVQEINIFETDPSYDFLMDFRIFLPDFLNKMFYDIVVLFSVNVVVFYTAPWIAFYLSIILGSLSLFLKMFQANFNFKFVLSKWICDSGLNVIFILLSFLGVIKTGCHPVYKGSFYSNRAFILNETDGILIENFPTVEENVNPERIYFQNDVFNFLNLIFLKPSYGFILSGKSRLIRSDLILRIFNIDLIYNMETFELDEHYDSFDYLYCFLKKVSEGSGFFTDKLRGRFEHSLSIEEVSIEIRTKRRYREVHNGGTGFLVAGKNDSLEIDKEMFLKNSLPFFDIIRRHSIEFFGSFRLDLILKIIREPFLYSKEYNSCKFKTYKCDISEILSVAGYKLSFLAYKNRTSKIVNKYVEEAKLSESKKGNHKDNDKQKNFSLKFYKGFDEIINLSKKSNLSFEKNNKNKNKNKNGGGDMSQNDIPTSEECDEINKLNRKIYGEKRNINSLGMGVELVDNYFSYIDELNKKGKNEEFIVKYKDPKDDKGFIELNFKQALLKKKEEILDCQAKEREREAERGSKMNNEEEGNFSIYKPKEFNDIFETIKVKGVKLPKTFLKSKKDEAIKEEGSYSESRKIEDKNLKTRLKEGFQQIKFKAGMRDHFEKIKEDFIKLENQFECLKEDLESIQQTESTLDDEIQDLNSKLKDAKREKGQGEDLKFIVNPISELKLQERMYKIQKEQRRKQIKNPNSKISKSQKEDKEVKDKKGQENKEGK